jgi:hypothetical protein
MGKQSKSSKGKSKALERKIDKSTLPPPPPKPEDEIGSAKPLDKPALPGRCVSCCCCSIYVVVV